MEPRQLQASVDEFLAVHPLATPTDGDAALAERLVAQRLFAARERSARVGSIELLRCIGAGGMGRVYLGRDVDEDREVAVKLLRAPIGVSDRGDQARRLRREARALARVQHPNVVDVLSVGHDEDQGVYVAMEYVAGTTLRAWLGPDRPPVPTIVAALAACASGLHAAHEAGIVHRDFKPDNVLAGRDGTIKIADFGLARTRPAGNVGGWKRLESTLSTASLGGTVAYMAPERVDGRAPDVGNDVFAFCLSAWELLAGKKPVNFNPPVADVPVSSRLARTLVHGLAADPDERLRSMQPLVEAFAHELAPKRPRWPMLAAVIVLAGVVVAIALATR